MKRLWILALLLLSLVNVAHSQPSSCGGNPIFNGCTGCGILYINTTTREMWFGVRPKLFCWTALAPCSSIYGCTGCSMIDPTWLASWGAVTRIRLELWFCGATPLNGTDLSLASGFTFVAAYSLVPSSCPTDPAGHLITIEFPLSTATEIQHEVDTGNGMIYIGKWIGNAPTAGPKTVRCASNNDPETRMLVRNKGSVCWGAPDPNNDREGFAYNTYVFTSTTKCP